jgi:hypothetical protein
MKILLLLLLFSVQVFSLEPLTAREKNIFAALILETFSSSSRKFMEEPIINVLGEINPDSAAKVLGLAIDKLANYKGPITPSYVKGMILGIDAGVNLGVSAAVATQLESKGSTVAPNISQQTPSDDNIADGSADGSADDYSEQEQPDIIEDSPEDTPETLYNN